MGSKVPSFTQKAEMELTLTSAFFSYHFILLLILALHHSLLCQDFPFFFLATFF
jgi:hypothetical protein